MKQTYRPPEKDNSDPYRSEPLPVDRPAAIYYRQSTDAQIGNVNTSIQTVDMFEHLVAQGWSRDSIIMIDMDAGVSGSTKLKDRPGMSRLIELIDRIQSVWLHHRMWIVSSVMSLRYRPISSSTFANATMCGF